jgi:hypothetical protein
VQTYLDLLTLKFYHPPNPVISKDVKKEMIPTTLIKNCQLSVTVVNIKKLSFLYSFWITRENPKILS